ncbi:MAG: carbon-nitrogen hydrolase family protein [Bacteroidota bacterium]
MNSMKPKQKLLYYIFFTGLILLSLVSSHAWGRNYVKIATIGGVPPHLDLTQEPQKLVEQMIAFWEGELAQVLPDKPDLIVLPEACDRPSGMTTEVQLQYFKVRGNQVMEYFASVAKNNHCYIAFGMKHQLEDGSWRNSCILLDREGNTNGIYNKNFPTIGEMEAGIKAGKEAPLFQCDFGSVACAICFDLNFDELRIRYAAQRPDIIVFPSMYHGGLVQANWAYSCRSYFVSSIAIVSLRSEIRNPMGDVVATSTNYFDYTVSTINLDYCLAHLDYNWSKLEELKKKYGPEVTIHDPGEIGSVMITSESDQVSAKEMAKEFEITLLDDYLEDSREYRHKPGIME